MAVVMLKKHFTKKFSFEALKAEDFSLEVVSDGIKYSY